MSTDFDISAVNERIAKESAFIDDLLTEIGKVVVGQKYMIERLLVGLLGDGHILLEGVPGSGKDPYRFFSCRSHWHPVSADPVYS